MNRIDDLEDVMCKGNMMLEPRLQEYLKKRTYYKKNNIKPSIPLEEEFMITSDDLKRLRLFLKGDKGIYESHRQEEFIDSNECLGYNDKNKFNFFPSREFKNDPHFKLMQKKMQRDKDAEKQRHNYDDYIFMKPTEKKQTNYHSPQNYENSNLMPEIKESDSFEPYI
jgi:hypothetical protein